VVSDRKDHASSTADLDLPNSDGVDAESVHIGGNGLQLSTDVDCSHRMM